MRGMRYLIAGIAAMVIAGCGALPTPTQVPPPPPSAEADVSASPTPATAPTCMRGNRLKALGEQSAAGCPGATIVPDCEVVFTVDRYTECTGTGYHGDPVDGLRRIVWITATTGPSYGTSETGLFTINGNDMRFIGSDGVSRSIDVSVGWRCVPEGQDFPQYDNWQRSTTYSGGIEVVVPEPSGTLVYNPSWVSNAGWEWSVMS